MYLTSRSRGVRQPIREISSYQSVKLQGYDLCPSPNRQRKQLQHFRRRSLRKRRRVGRQPDRVDNSRRLLYHWWRISFRSACQRDLWTKPIVGPAVYFEGPYLLLTIDGPLSYKYSAALFGDVIFQAPRRYLQTQIAKQNGTTWSYLFTQNLNASSPTGGKLIFGICLNSLAISDLGLRLP